MSSKQIYIRFLSILHALEGREGAPVMDLDARKLLEVIAVRHAQNQPLTITDAMALSHIASPATIHRKLDQLRESGMIDSHYEGSNRRTKYLKPTEKAQMYFSTVGGLIQQASQTI